MFQEGAAKKIEVRSFTHYIVIFSDSDLLGFVFASINLTTGKQLPIIFRILMIGKHTALSTNTILRICAKNM